MMRRSVLILLLLPMVIAACDQGSEPASPRQQISVRSEGQQRMHQLNDLNRAIALKRALYDTGAECRRVTRSGYVGEYENSSQWTATCEDRYKRTRDWALFISPDDSVQVRLCEDVVKAGLPACVIRDEARSAKPG